MDIIFKEGEKLTSEQVAHLTIFLGQIGRQDKLKEMIDNHIGNMFEVYDYVMSTSYGFYNDKYKIIHAIPELEKIHEAVYTLPSEITYKQRVETLMPYKEQMINRIKKNVGKHSYNSNEYIDIFQLDMDESSGIDRNYVVRSVGRYERIRIIYEHILKPVINEETEINNDYKKIIFEDCMYYYVFNKIKNCFRTSNNLNTIKSIFCYSTEDLKIYLEIFDFVANKFDEFKFEEIIEKDKFDVFHKKYNKWVCSSLIR